jgi:folate-dependent phosphoribosylglycinamide formyltransferase PurN
MLNTLRVAVLCSRRAPGLAHLLDHDPNRGRSYELVGLVTSDPECVEREPLAEAGVPRALDDIRRFYAARGARLGDLAHRPDYDRATIEILARFRPDLVILCGYLHIVTPPLLEAYPERILNLHDADLTLRDGAGRPRYPGLHAVRDAVFAGERETRSTVHLVTPEVDGGPLLLRSWAFPTHALIDAARHWGAADILKAYAYAHREWMMRAAWGRLLATAIDLYAHEQVSVGDGCMIVGGARGPRDLSARASRQHDALATAGGSIPAPWER